MINTDISTSTHEIYNASYGDYNYTKFTFKTEGFYKIELYGVFLNTGVRTINIWLNTGSLIDMVTDSASQNTDNDDYNRFNMYFIRYFNENDYIDFRASAKDGLGNKYLKNLKILFTKL